MRARILAVVVALAVLAAGIVVGVSTGGSGRVSVAQATADDHTGTTGGVTGITGGVTTTAAGVTTGTVDGTDTSDTASGLTTTIAVQMTQPTVTSRALPQPPPAGLPGTGRPPVTVGDMNTAPQFIIGELYAEALQQLGYSVSLTRNVGTDTTLGAEAQDALRQGLLSVYPQYLEQWNRAVAGHRRRFTSLVRAYTFGARFARRHGFRLLTPAPGGVRFGFAVTTQFARENDVYSLSALAHMQTELSFGVPLSFGGLAAAQNVYGFTPGVVRTVDTGTQYQDLAAGTIQVAYAQSADPQLVGSQFTLLRDPRHVFGFGNLVPVTTPAVIKAEGPAFVRTINRVDALLTTRALRGLTQELVIDHALVNHQALGAIARVFLQGNGILPEPRYAVVPQTTSATTTGAPALNGRSSQSRGSHALRRRARRPR